MFPYYWFSSCYLVPTINKFNFTFAIILKWKIINILLRRISLFWMNILCNFLIKKLEYKKHLESKTASRKTFSVLIDMMYFLDMFRWGQPSKMSIFRKSKIILIHIHKFEGIFNLCNHCFLIEQTMTEWQNIQPLVQVIGRGRKKRFGYICILLSVMIEFQVTTW